MTEEKDFNWTPKQKRGYSTLILGSLIGTFLIIVLCAPSCPSKSAEGTFSDGKYYFDKKDYKRAYLFYTHSIKLNPNYSQAYWERATTGMKIDSFENTIDDLTKFISLSKNADSLRNAYYLRATAEDTTGYKVDACDDFSTACELNLNKACDVHRKKCK